MTRFGIALVPRAVGFTRRCRFGKTLRWAPTPSGISADRPEYGAGFCALPRTEGPPPPGRRHPHRRRTTDAGHRSRPTSRPELLLIDELSLGLAPRITKEIYQATAGLELDTTVLLVEQNVELALKHSQRAYIMESGRMTRCGRSESLWPRMTSGGPTWAYESFTKIALAKRRTTEVKNGTRGHRFRRADAHWKLYRRSERCSGLRIGCTGAEAAVAMAGVCPPMSTT